MQPEVHESRSAATVAFVLILFAGIAHLAFGVTAISGAESLLNNVREIESDVSFEGKTIERNLYLSLETWGLIMFVLGVGEIAAAASFARRSPNWRLAGLIAAYGGLTGAIPDR